MQPSFRFVDPHSIGLAGVARGAQRRLLGVVRRDCAEGGGICEPGCDRAASEDDCVPLAGEALDEMAANGTTTCEATSAMADAREELRQLRVSAVSTNTHRVDMCPPFGALTRSRRVPGTAVIKSRGREREIRGGVWNGWPNCAMSSACVGRVQSAGIVAFYRRGARRIKPACSRRMARSGGCRGAVKVGARSADHRSSRRGEGSGRGACRRELRDLRRPRVLLKAGRFELRDCDLSGACGRARERLIPRGFSPSMPLPSRSPAREGMTWKKERRKRRTLNAAWSWIAAESAQPETGEAEDACRGGHLADLLRVVLAIRFGVFKRGSAMTSYREWRSGPARALRRTNGAGGGSAAALRRVGVSS